MARSLVATAVVRDEVDRPGTGLGGFGSVSVRGRLRPPARRSSSPRSSSGRAAGCAWLTTVSLETAPAVAAVPGTPDVRVAAPPVAPHDVRVRRRGALVGRLGRLRSPRPSRGSPRARLDKVVLGPRPRGGRRPASSTRGGCCGASPSSTSTTWVFAVDGLVGATPELLVRREKGLVTSRVLAGTIRRTGDDEHGPRARGVARPLVEGPRGARVRRALGRRRPRAALLLDERARGAVRAAPVQRHAPRDRRRRGARRRRVVPGPRRVAAPVGGGVRHARRRWPTASSPSSSTWTAGATPGRSAGSTPSGDGEWGIALRCGAVSQADPSRIRLFAGCGIVAGSDPEAEVAESSAKFMPDARRPHRHRLSRASRPSRGDTARATARLHLDPAGLA